MALSEQARKLRNEYQRTWRHKNPERIKQININYWEKRANKTTVTDNVTDKNKVTDNSNTAICDVCGTPFIARRKDSKYCSSACKQKHYRLKN